VRLYIRGPHLGPFRTVLWSSHGGAGGRHSQWWYLLLTPFAAILLWTAFTTSWQFDAIVGGIIALAAFGYLASRRETRALATTLEQVRNSVARINARPAEIRARLREQNRTGELAPIPGWHWTDGDLLEYDAPSPPEPQAKYSDRR
jgi:hypothetical protein